MTVKNIDFPVEQSHTGKGNPKIISNFENKLNNRQMKLLELLLDYNSTATVPKKSVSMTDLSALTAETGAEYALFTRGAKRLVIRGSENMVDIDEAKAKELAEQGYRWSGHTHPGYSDWVLWASEGDIGILAEFDQPESAIYNSFGEHKSFKNTKRRK